MISLQPQHRNGPLAAAFATTRTASASRAIDGPQHGDAEPAAASFGSLLRKAQRAKASSGAVLRVSSAGFDRSRAHLPDSYLSSSAAELIRAVRHLLTATPSAADRASLPSFESLYAIAEAQLDAGASVQDLHDRVKIEMERAAGQLARSLGSSGASEITTESAVTWLGQLSEAWNGWLDRVALVQSVLLPLDRELAISRVGGLAGVADLAIVTFAWQVMENSDLRGRALACISASVEADRRGSIQYRQLHSSLLQMFVKLSAYDVLEHELVDATRRFYRAESAVRLGRDPIGEYLSYAHDRVQQEAERAAWLLSSEVGRQELVAAARIALVTDHVDKLLAGLPELIEARRLAELAKLFALLQSVNVLGELRSGFADYIKKAGEVIVNDRDRDDEMIDRLIDFKAGIDAVVFESFAKQPEFLHAQRDSFEVFVNKRENKPAELIAKFLDAKLRSGNKTMTDEELEHCLDEALALFRCTHDKDMFEEFYKRYFAKRLLLNRSASSDAEKSMLLKLKEECGAGFTAKLETMIKDIELSKDLMQEFAQARAKAIKEGAAPDAFDLNVSVLTQAHWPTYPQIDVVLPPNMAAATDQFLQFYQTRNSGRRLHWQHSLGTLSLVAHFAKAGTKELNVSTFQAVVLLLFNSLGAGEKLSYRDIQAQTGLEDKELKRTLQSLACGQIPTRVLRKTPQGKEVLNDDEFAFNEGFKNERHRIRINQIQMKETAEEQKTTEQRVFLDRELILQAAAVRVLKARKTIKHGELVTEVVDQIKSRFAVDVSEIKKTFEILIDKEYMERVEGERGVYRYLA
ncbi:hypothetical protein ACQY0O_004701 [Thecaphora frezii]